MVVSGTTDGKIQMWDAEKGVAFIIVFRSGNERRTDYGIVFHFRWQAFSRWK